MNARTTTTRAADTAAPDAPRCQSCHQPIRPDELVHVAPSPDGSTWHMHASVAQCLARLTNATIESVAAALVRLTNATIESVAAALVRP